jgi:hypothetical protein
MLGMLEGFPPDSARTRKPVATMTATQNIDLAAFDILMLLVLFCAPASGFFCRIAADALRFGAGDIAQAAGYKASRIFGPQVIWHFERSNRMPL